MYKVASASQFLVITGAGIKEMKIVKKGWILPGQSCSVFDISQITYSFTAQVMSIEKRRLGLPFVYTIGPQADDEASLLKYAKLISASDKHSNYVKELVQGIIEGETRAVAASLKFGDIFKGTQAFKDAVFEKVQHELIQFGLLIYNANVKQLVSGHGRLFYSPSVQARAENQAKVDVAEAKMKGDTGVKLREGKILQNAAKIDAETKVIIMQRQGAGKKEELEVHTDVKIFENKREAEIAEANAELAMKKAGWNQQAELAGVEGTKAVALRESELQRQVEAQNALTRTEKLKAEFLSKASVEYDVKVQEANWKLYEKQKAAEAELYEQDKKAAAQRALASAALYARQQSADGELYAKERQAEGVVVFTQAQEMYVRTVLDALGGDYSALRDYMMINGRLFQDLALINVEAIQGLQPTISIWTTGNAVKIVDGVGNGASAMEGNGVQSIS